MSRIGRHPVAVPAGVEVTKRFKENEILTRINKNTDSEYGNRCKPGI